MYASGYLSAGNTILKYRYGMGRAVGVAVSVAPSRLLHYGLQVLFYVISYLIKGQFARVVETH